jgi:hypothetical protein
MYKPEGTGSDREDDAIVLPSWIDAAISRTQGPDAAPGEAEPAPLPDDAVEPVADEPPTEEFVRPLGAAPSNESFPSFLDRRGSMAYETERIHDEEPAEAAPPEPIPGLFERTPLAVPEPTRDFLARQPVDEFDAAREEIVSQAMAEDAVAQPDPIPLPIAPARRRAPTGPWFMAALFFAAAALVLAVLIWLKPLP